MVGISNEVFMIKIENKRKGITLTDIWMAQKRYDNSDLTHIIIIHIFQTASL